MLLIVLPYIALYQKAFQGFFTMLIYPVGLSIPLIIISSVGGTVGKAPVAGCLFFNACE
jgi:cytochrome c biogenesis protein CcdA